MQNIPAKFALYNAAPSKNLVVVVVIEGVKDIFSSGPVGTTLRYGDPVTYGTPGLVYGGIRPYTSSTGGVVQQLISIQNSALNITQTCEPEQGRSSVSQMQISFIDLNGYMTKLCSPGQVIPDILGTNATVYLGYSEISFPEDYLLVFRGVIQSVSTTPGLYTLSIGDPNVKRRQTIFYSAQTVLSAPIDGSVSTIPVIATDGFHQPVYDATGNVDSSVICYLHIDDEIMAYYLPTSVASGTSFINVQRGQRGTSAVAHSAGATVSAEIEIGTNVTAGGVNPLELALKIMLSGWDGPFLTNVPIAGLAYASGVTNQEAIFLSGGTNAVQDLGLSVGDYVTVSGDTYSANNGVWTITAFADLNQYPNNIIVTNRTFVTSPLSPAVIALRSQYDTLPITCGLQMPPNQVDVAQHQYLMNSYFTNLAENMTFYLTSSQSSGKQFIEQELYLPIACYSLTSQGQCSVAVVIPPLATQILQQINYSNVLDPKSIALTRDVSNRNFFNEIDWQYDSDGTGNFNTFVAFIDSASLTTIGLSSVLPITSQGISSNITTQTVINQRSQRFLSRYQGAATLINLKINFAAANSISPGSVVLLTDNGTLNIPDFSTGNTYLGQALYEVRNWSLDVKSGMGTIQLLSSGGFLVTDRFGTFAPSSYCAATGNTTTVVNILPSFGAIFGAAEYKKWTSYIGATLWFHDASYSTTGTAVLQAVLPSNVLVLSSALGYVPDGNIIVDLYQYPTSTDPTVEALEKQIHAFFDRSAPIVSGTSHTQFTINAGDEPYFVAGNPILVHSPDWSVNNFSSTPNTVTDAKIVSVVGTTVTVTDLGFTPLAGYLCEILAFNDGGLGYRWV